MTRIWIEWFPSVNNPKRRFRQLSTHAQDNFLSLKIGIESEYEHISKVVEDIKERGIMDGRYVKMIEEDYPWHTLFVKVKLSLSTVSLGKGE